MMTKRKISLNGIDNKSMVCKASTYCFWNHYHCRPHQKRFDCDQSCCHGEDTICISAKQIEKTC